MNLLTKKQIVLLYGDVTEYSNRLRFHACGSVGRNGYSYYRDSIDSVLRDIKCWMLDVIEKIESENNNVG